MGYYQQTLLIPKPKQRLSDRKVGRSSYEGPKNVNGGINAILAYFDRSRCVG